MSIDDNSISFQFDPAKFNSISSQLDLLSQLNDSGELQLAFEDYNFNFNSLFSFESNQVTIGTTGSNTIEFEYDPASFNFTGAELFQTNANLFDYKFLDSEISLVDGEIPFVEYNASDYRALEYAFTGDELFDPQYYLASNVIPDDMNPFTDYMENGYRAGRNPSALFNVSYYLSHNPDVRIAGVDPLGHYARFGYAEDHENRNPSAVFNNAYYNQNNPDVVDAKMPSLLHYILFGDGEDLDSRDPNPAFDNSYYNQMNPDVAQSDMTALEHYMLFGWKESRPDHPNYNPNRNPSVFLNSTDYFILNNDVLTVSYEYDSANPLQHLLEFGFAEKRLTHRMFESENIAKITKVVTPDSDPQEISHLKQSLKQDGYNLTAEDNKIFKISGAGIFTDEDGSFNLFEPIEDAAGALFVGAVAYTVYKGGTIIRGIADGISSLTWQDVFEGFTNAGDALTISGYTALPIGKETTDTLSISYNDISNLY